MPTVFLSYARDDLALVQKLAHALVAHGTTVWRDQDSIHGGQQWPKAIGEAILAHDVLMLVWSKHAAQSHFVEFEWTTAVALRKTLLPCLLDAAPLPPALSAINGITVNALEDAMPKILQALQKPVTATDPEHGAAVLEELARITPVKPKRTWLETWQPWAAFAATLLTVVVLLPGLPMKLRETFQPNTNNVQVVQTLAGVIWDEAHEPLPGVEVVLPELNVTTTTDRHGKFSFQVNAPAQRSVNLIARKTVGLTQSRP